MAKWIRRITALAAASGALLWAGCQNLHNENTKLAEARWARARSAVQLQLADQQFRSGQLDKALLTLGKALEIDPNFPKLHVLRGEILAEKGQGQAAVAAYELALSMDPKVAEAHYHCGVQLERWGQFDKALGHYQAAHELDPANACYVVAMAEMLGQLNRTSDALGLIDKTLAVQEQSVALRVTAGELCLSHNDYASAVRYFREAARLATDDSGIIRSLAMALYHSGKLDEARPYLEQLASQASRGDALAKGRTAGQALTGGLRARAGGPPQLSSTVAPGAGDSGEPAASPDAEGDSTAGLAELLSALGDCQLAARQPAKARQSFLQVVRLCPDRPEPYVNLCKVAVFEGQWPEALSNADQAIARSGDLASAHLTRGYALNQLNRPAEAVESLQTAHRLAPRDVLALCLLSDSHRKLGHEQPARDWLVRALQIAPTDPLANRMMNELAGGEPARPTVAPAGPPTVSAGVVVP